MKHKKWILIPVFALLLGIVGTIVGMNLWYKTGNVRVLMGNLRVKLSGNAYVIDHETGEIIGQTLVMVDGQTVSGTDGAFNGTLDVMDYYNENEGTLTSNKGVLQGEDGYWEIHLLENCCHTEENEDGTSKEVNHSCKYSFIYIVHPDKQDFMIVRVKDKYEVYPLYAVMADSEEEALQLYRDYLGE